MRVAYVSADPGVPVFGSKGCSIHVQEILRCFLSRGDELEIFTTRTGGDTPNDLESCTTHLFEAMSKQQQTIIQRELDSVRLAKKIESALATRGPFDLVYERQSLWSSAGADYALACGCPSILEVNAPLIEEQSHFRDLVNIELAREIAANCFARASSIAAVSEDMADYVREHYPQTSTKTHVVPNGVDTRRFSPGPSKLTTAKEITIGFVGSLKPWHGVEFLLQAFTLFLQNHPGARLIVLGSGPSRSELQARYTPQGSQLSQRVLWQEAVPASEVPQWLQRMDIAVAPYPALEHFYFSPLKVYEYMSCGLAVVASRIGQLRSIIEHGHNGLLCQPGDPIDLASCLSTLASDSDYRRELGHQARLKALQQFSWTQVLSESLTHAGFPMGSEQEKVRCIASPQGDREPACRN